jgi:hypothetical protein
MSPKLRNYLLFIILTLVRFAALAQGRPDGPPPPDTRMPPSFPGLAVPIDSNILLLVIAGFLLCIYAVLKSKNRERELS